MAKAASRLWVMRDQEFRDYCEFFLMEKAFQVLLASSPNADDLGLAKLVIVRKAPIDQVAFAAVYDATLGGLIDANVAPGHALVINDTVSGLIRTAIQGQFHNLAVSYRAAGLFAEPAV